MAKKKPAKHIEKKQSKKNIKLLYQVIAAIAILALIVFLVFPDLLKKNNSDEGYPFTKEGELTFYTSDANPIVTIDIEIAETEYERQLGLMKRKEIQEKQGMLFKFPDETLRSFWMRNTFISLDMIFINSQREIVTIQKNTTPLSDQSYPSTEPAVYVVEVKAGFTDKYGIHEGDKIGWMDIKL